MSIVPIRDELVPHCGREEPLGDAMGLFRATVVGVVGAAVVLLAPGVAAAGSGTAPQHCEQMWLWWIPMPCL
jgi:hypothetical protein